MNHLKNTETKCGRTNSNSGIYIFVSCSYNTHSYIFKCMDFES